MIAAEILTAKTVPQEGQQPEEEHNPWAHCMVMWGNLLYEASQMYAAGGNKDWKDSLDAAVEKFRAAGCPEPDIQAALRNHTEADQLDLPPVKVCPVSPRCLFLAHHRAYKIRP